MMGNARVVRFLLAIAVCLATLTGCVDYDVGVNFATPYSGKIVQHITVGDRLNTLAPSEIKQWLKSLEKRSRKLKGKVKRIEGQELILTIPFGNSAELASKFNQLFQASTDSNLAIPQEEGELLKLNSQVSIQQSNLLFAERNYLDLAIDLRALAILTQQDKILLPSDSVANIEFKLTTPWIARSVSRGDNLQPVNNSLDQGLVWQLHPGEVNHISVIFWLPSPLGIGAAAITLLMLLGYMLKYRRFPGLAG